MTRGPWAAADREGGLLPSAPHLVLLKVHINGSEHMSLLLLGSLVPKAQKENPTGWKPNKALPSRGGALHARLPAPSGPLVWALSLHHLSLPIPL